MYQCLIIIKKDNKMSIWQIHEYISDAYLIVSIQITILPLNSVDKKSKIIEIEIKINVRRSVFDNDFITFFATSDSFILIDWYIKTVDVRPNPNNVINAPINSCSIKLHPFP